MSESLTVRAYSGEYSVFFNENALRDLNAGDLAGCHFMIDEKVACLYKNELGRILASNSVLLIAADEKSKSLDRFPDYITRLMSHGIRRGHTLVAIGGGVIQDITCFLGATLLRGVKWEFYPTTLLAQADSCIGSKSSINVGEIKNILGTFTPPARIYVCAHLLKTLEKDQLRSGIGEMLKVHAIAGPEAFDKLSADYGDMCTDLSLLERYIRRSLEIKRAIIETDEFDKGPRNILNYGHSFGHAIESATDFAVPHGIAVTIGMDIANFVAVRLGLTEKSVYERMHRPLRVNFSGFERAEIPLDKFLAAISKDKKNTDAELRLIMPDKNSVIMTRLQQNDSRFRDACAQYLVSGRLS